MEIPLQRLDTVGQQLQANSSNSHPLCNTNNFMLYVLSAKTVILRSEDLFLPDVFKYYKS